MILCTTAHPVQSIMGVGGGGGGGLTRSVSQSAEQGVEKLTKMESRCLGNDPVARGLGKWHWVWVSAKYQTSYLILEI